MNIKPARIIAALSLFTGIILLVSGLGWESLILPRAYEFAMSEGGGREMNLTDGGGDEPIMEGRFGLMSIIWDGIEGRETLEEGEFPTVDMFDTVWKEVEITGNGIINRDTGEPMFDSLDNAISSGEGETFPMGGVDRRDYEIFNSALNRTVTVEYSGTTEVKGRTAYIFKTNITKEPMDSLPSNFGSSEDGSGENPLPFDGDLELLYTDQTTYYLDPETSIPLNLKLDITSEFVFPDSTLLQVQEEQVQYSEETVWLPSDTIPGRMEGQEVIKETITRGEISEEDPLVALYTVDIRYYDPDTGEPLEELNVDGSETFVVDRDTYKYIPGYLGTSRSGYYQFPIGNVEKRDYPMWDEALGAENMAVFLEETVRAGQPVYRYRMTTTDVEVDSGNAVLPIYYHPGTEYTLDTVQDWYIDSGTGMMLDMTIDGTIYVSTAGPLGIIDQSVGSFNVDLPDNTTSILLAVSELYRDLLLPLSGKPINAFSMELEFTDNMQREMAAIAEQVALFVDLLEVKAPLALMITGTVLAGIPVAMAIFIRIRRKRSSSDDMMPYVAEEVY